MRHGDVMDARVFVRLLHTTCQRGHGSSITVEIEARSILPWGRSAPRGAFDDRKESLRGRVVGGRDTEKLREWF
ncbi:hypothetical protein DBV15_03085 [Temnothorax longispinosus]|uniref:Uncharacterized protein n=1 Tax=Temnothorax longispinosus TaxID=300112 RepID=A0A4V3SAJ9_9HYME|nr:hypothetical protein DBV15_03085 [Temnothorax longispinosus]